MKLLLHELVIKFQIHTYKDTLCSESQAPTEQYRKGFPASLSSLTYLQENDL